MRVFRPTYSDKRTGQTKQQQKYWVEFRDHRGKQRRLPACHHKREAETFGRHIEDLVRLASLGERPDDSQQRWIEGLPESIVGRIRKWGLIASVKMAFTESLKDHCEDFRRSLRAKGRTEQYVRETFVAISGIADACGFSRWRDIDGARVEHHLADLRDVHGTSARTYNQKLKAFKQFSAWMVREGRATESPVRHLSTLNVRSDRRRVRRAFTSDEACVFLDATCHAEPRYGMSGRERALLYRLAMETGLRANELRSLTPAGIDCESGTVTIRAAHSKRRCEDVVRLRPKTARALASEVSSKGQTQRVFNMPSKDRLAAMLRDDLKQAGLPYRDEEGRYLDFHSFRHTFGTWAVTDRVKTGHRGSGQNQPVCSFISYTFCLGHAREFAMVESPDWGRAQGWIARIGGRARMGLT